MQPLEIRPRFSRPTLRNPQLGAGLQQQQDVEVVDLIDGTPGQDLLGFLQGASRHEWWDQRGGIDGGRGASPGQELERPHREARVRLGLGDPPLAHAAEGSPPRVGDDLRWRQAVLSAIDRVIEERVASLIGVTEGENGQQEVKVRRPVPDAVGIRFSGQRALGQGDADLRGGSHPERRDCPKRQHRAIISRA